MQKLRFLHGSGWPGSAKTTRPTRLASRRRDRPSAGIDAERPFAVGPANRRCAQDCGHRRNATVVPRPTVSRARPRTEQFDPKRTSRIGLMNGREARESGLWLKASVVPPAVLGVRTRRLPFQRKKDAESAHAFPPLGVDRPHKAPLKFGPRPGAP
jgi:hypothetical protein